MSLLVAALIVLAAAAVAVVAFAFCTAERGARYWPTRGERRSCEPVDRLLPGSPLSTASRWHQAECDAPDASDDEKS